jgi:K+-transporting ATPase ATPase A chain
MSDALQIILFLALVAATTPLIGGYMAKIFAGERTLLSPAFSPIERGFYVLGGIDRGKEQSWLASCCCF